MPIARIDKAANTRLRLNPKPQSQIPSGCFRQIVPGQVMGGSGGCIVVADGKPAGGLTGGPG